MRQSRRMAWTDKRYSYFPPACSHREKKQTSWRVRERNAKKFSLKVSKRGFTPDKRT